MEKNITLEHKFPDGKPSEVIIRTGNAAAPFELEKVDLVGTINSVSRFVENRKETFDSLESSIIICRDRKFIMLRINERDPKGISVVGKLSVHPIFEEFGINTGTFRTTTELAEFYKFKRSYFENHSENMRLVSELRNFRGKVDKEIEKSSSQRGDKRLLINQVVTSNLPESFMLTMPLFKGNPKTVFSVELYFNPDDLTCSMVSAEAADYMETFIDDAIDAEIEKLKQYGIVIIEA